MLNYHYYIHSDLQNGGFSIMAELMNRRALKAESKQMLADAQVSPKAMTALYLGLLLALNLVPMIPQEAGLLATFITILVTLMRLILSAGFVLYCMAIRRGERAEFLTLFDGFAFVGKIIALNIVLFVFVFLWSMLFLFPGIIAMYRYRFALFNLYENPEIGVMEALALSSRQTFGYKMQLFTLDLSYFGWTLLAGIPSIFYSGSFYQDTYLAASEYVASTISFVSPEFSAAAIMPAVVWTLIIGVWDLVVSMFYYPNFQCVELAYFETAKRTSGFNADTFRRNRRNGPDSMGGF